MKQKEKPLEVATDQIVRWPTVHKITGGMSRPTIWRWEQAGAFPRRVLLSKTGTSVGWRLSEINAWIESRHNTDVKPA